MAVSGNFFAKVLCPPAILNPLATKGVPNNTDPIPETIAPISPSLCAAVPWYPNGKPPPPAWAAFDVPSPPTCLAFLKVL